MTYIIAYRVCNGCKIVSKMAQNMAQKGVKIHPEMAQNMAQKWSKIHPKSGQNRPQNEPQIGPCPEGVKIGLLRGYSGHVQKQASKCGKNRQVLAGFSEMAVLGVKIGPK